MKLIISFVIASLFCFVLIVPAEAQQPTKSQTPAKEKEEQSSKETVVVKSRFPCFSDKRIKEYEEGMKQADEVNKRFMTGEYGLSFGEERMMSFLSNLNSAAEACHLRRAVEIQLASHDESLKKEQLEKVSDAATKIVAEFNARGEEASFAVTDLRILIAYVTAVRAKGVMQKAASPSLTKMMTKEQIQHAIETCKTVLKKFNESGTVYGDDSDRVMDIFLMVVLATETMQKAGSPKLIKNLKQEKIQDAIKRSERILAEFKKNEWNSKFADDDLGFLESFLLALKLPVEQKQVTVTKKTPTPTKAIRKQRRRAP